MRLIARIVLLLMAVGAHAADTSAGLRAAGIAVATDAERAAVAVTAPVSPEASADESAPAAPGVGQDLRLPAPTPGQDIDADTTPAVPDQAPRDPASSAGADGDGAAARADDDEDEVSVQTGSPAPAPAEDASTAAPVGATAEDSAAAAVAGEDPAAATPSQPDATAGADDALVEREAKATELESFCSRIDAKLSSIDAAECLDTGLVNSGALSHNEIPLYVRDFVPENDEPVARVLLIGGIHGDEYSSVSVVFKWLGILQHELGDNFHWRIVPVLNPDGLLRPPRMSQRMNANGVDLNRNFPTPNWEREAHEYWINRTRRNKRRYPGPAALSEPESAWLAEQIELFQPHAVISVHAPHGVVDFDGPRLPPRQLGPLELRLLGTYPGSMGRYIGVHKGIPILTVELESAFGMPRRPELLDIWYDMVGWLHEKIATPMQIAEKAPATPPAELLRVDSDPDNDG